MYLAIVLWTLSAWVVGFVIDANLGYGETLGFTCFRILFPLITIALCIIYELKNSSKK